MFQSESTEINGRISLAISNKERRHEANTNQNRHRVLELNGMRRLKEKLFAFDAYNS